MLGTNRLQINLANAGYDPGGIDGDLGPKTYRALFSYMAGRDLGKRGTDLGLAAAKFLPAVRIDTPLRLAHFLAQCSAETGAFQFMRELWGPTPAQKKYEGRADLGNTTEGDGRRFLGRGIFQITGRDNYERYGKRCGVDLTRSPEQAETPAIAMQVAALYWSDHELNRWADQDNILGTSNGINRGNPASIRAPNGYEHRKKALARAKKVLL